MFSRVRLAILPAIFAALSVLSAAQSTSSLHGVVTDARGAVLPGATVTINDSETGFTRTVTSGGDGVYQVLQIPPSKYAVSVTAQGFASIRHQNLTLQVNTPATL